MEAKKLVLLERRGKIAVISLQRPKRHNALTPQLLSELLSAFNHVDSQSASAVILRAEGASFSTGGDLRGFQQHRDSIVPYSCILVGLLNLAIITIYSHPSPVVCAVQGQVTGGSLGLLLAADRVIMRRGVTLTPYYSVVGFSPDGGWTALLPDIIGRQQALHWIANNDCLDADSCLALGLAHQVEETDTDEAALVWAENIANLQSSSINRSERLLNTNIAALRLRLEVERQSFVAQIQTQQALDGIDHFLRRHEHE